MVSRETAAQIIKYCRRMDAKGWVSNHDGNVSVRDGSGGFLITPTARSKADLTEADLIVVDSTGRKTASAAASSTSGAPFSELAVHLRVYANRPDVQAVVHAHPPSATAVGCANQEMLTTAIPEAVVSLGPGVPLAGLALPNSPELWAEFDPLIPHYDAVLVGGNGVFAWGQSLEQAFLRLELVEHLATIFLRTFSFGGAPGLNDGAVIRSLTPGQVAELLAKRRSAGFALPPDPARPLWWPSGSIEK